MERITNRDMINFLKKLEIVLSDHQKWLIGAVIMAIGSYDPEKAKQHLLNALKGQVEDQQKLIQYFDMDVRHNSLKKCDSSFEKTIIRQILSKERIQKYNEFRVACGETVESFEDGTLEQLMRMVEWLVNVMKLSDSDRMLVEQKQKVTSCCDCTECPKHGSLLSKRRHHKKEKRRPSVVAIWEKKNGAKRNELPRCFNSRKAYEEGVKLAGILCGRLEANKLRVLFERCKQYDKHGLFHVDWDQKEKYDQTTLIWALLFKAELDVRKAFTLNSQMHGGLNIILELFLQEVLMKSETTDWEMIASLYPINSIVERLSSEQKEKFVQQWKHQLTSPTRHDKDRKTPYRF